MRRSLFEKNLFQKEDTELLGFLQEIIWLMARCKIKRKFVVFKKCVVFKECVILFITLYVDSTV